MINEGHHPFSTKNGIDPPTLAIMFTQARRILGEHAARVSYQQSALAQLGMGEGTNAPKAKATPRTTMDA